MFACIVTPVFDPCLDSIQLLRGDLLRQTHLPGCEDPCTCFKQILISNGASPKIKEWVESLDDPRFVYDEIKFDDLHIFRYGNRLLDVPKLVLSLRKRRNHCLKKYGYTAKRFFFWDADLEVIDDDYLRKTYDLHNASDVIVAKTYYINDSILPKYPIEKPSRIDLANYSISAKLARKYKFSPFFHPVYRVAEDFRFYSQISDRESVTHTDIIFARKDGRPLYPRLTDSLNNRN